ncbi:Sialin, partial [Fragariocoptes setiger]
LLDVNEEEYKGRPTALPIRWLAPECIKQKIFTHKSDVWAFGVTVWELLTYGRSPYEHCKDPRDLVHLLDTGDRLPHPKYASLDVYMVMTQCWYPQPELRPSFHELSDTFAKYARDPGRYLAIPGDKLMKLPFYSPQDEHNLFKAQGVPIEGGPEKVVVAEDYFHLRSSDTPVPLTPCNKFIKDRGFDLEQGNAAFDTPMSKHAPISLLDQDNDFSTTDDDAVSDANNNNRQNSKERKVSDTSSTTTADIPGQYDNMKNFRKSEAMSKHLDEIMNKLPVDDDDYLLPSPRHCFPHFSETCQAVAFDSLPVTECHSMTHGVDNLEYHLAQTAKYNCLNHTLSAHQPANISAANPSVVKLDNNGGGVPNMSRCTTKFRQIWDQRVIKFKAHNHAQLNEEMAQLTLHSGMSSLGSQVHTPVTPSCPNTPRVIHVSDTTMLRRSQSSSDSHSFDDQTVYISDDQTSDSQLFHTLEPDETTVSMKQIWDIKLAEFIGVPLLIEQPNVEPRVVCLDMNQFKPCNEGSNQNQPTGLVVNHNPTTIVGTTRACDDNASARAVSNCAPQLVTVPVNQPLSKKSISNSNSNKIVSQQQMVATSINAGRKKSHTTSDKYAPSNTIDGGPAAEIAPVTPRRKMGFFGGQMRTPIVGSRLLMEKNVRRVSEKNGFLFNEKSLLLSTSMSSSSGSSGLTNESSSFKDSGIQSDDRHTIIPIRCLIIAMSALATCVSYTIRVNMSVTLVAMVNQSSASHQHDSMKIATNSISSLDSLNGTQISTNNEVKTTLIDLNQGLVKSDNLNWSESMQGVALGAFYWGFIATHVFGGQLANSFSARYLCASSLLTASLLTIILPVAANHSVYTVIVLRAITGLCLGVVAPAMFTLMSRWIPQNERSTSIAIRMIGGNLGAVLAMSISGFLSDLIGWESGTEMQLESTYRAWRTNWTRSGDVWVNTLTVFYFIGGFGVIVFVLWIWVVDDSPMQHKWVCSNELEYIRANSNCMSTSQAKSMKLDWLSMIVSPRLWAVAIAKFCGSWGNLMLMQKLPSYLESELQMPIAKNGFINALVYVSMSVSLFVFGCLSDYLCSSTETFKTHRTLMRKVFEMFALCGPSICLACVPFVGHDQDAVISLLIIGMILYGMSAGGDNPIVVEMAPDFSGTLYGVTNAIASIPGFLAPIIVGCMLDSNKFGNQAEWNKIFFITAAIYAFGAIVFLAAATTEPQSWGLADFRKPAAFPKKTSIDKTMLILEEEAMGHQSFMQSTTILVDPFQTTYESSVHIIEHSQQQRQHPQNIDYGSVSSVLGYRFV